MTPLSPEQLLIIADEACAKWSTTVRSFSAICAAAAIPGARIEGIPVFDSPTAAATALARGIERLEPLTAFNKEFAIVAAEIYLRR
ncbi:TetR family transcriptional regulator [Corynebacterium tuscaniense]|uniref:TetR family transcriptional regulator n=1 Tax=Corynebacterium tuscaniense TaxID=302449 RepID=A0A2N6T654_9CORY|nr:TetR family transcriptional regulator [Corynebacterium tuscaniense]PMC64814.1 TetR family transcriptional regulator [Corynebacterium tuscaniense]